MKIEINENQKQGELKYPCLMKNIHNGAIFLFTGNSNSFCQGVVLLKADGIVPFGQTLFSLLLADFLPYSGSITLSND